MFGLDIFSDIFSWLPGQRPAQLPTTWRDRELPKHHAEYMRKRKELEAEYNKALAKVRRRNHGSTSAKEMHEQRVIGHYKERLQLLREESDKEWKKKVADRIRWHLAESPPAVEVMHSVTKSTSDRAPGDSDIDRSHYWWAKIPETAQKWQDFCAKAEKDPNLKDFLCRESAMDIKRAAGIPYVYDPIPEEDKGKPLDEIIPIDPQEAEPLFPIRDTVPSWEDGSTSSSDTDSADTLIAPISAPGYLPARGPPLSGSDLSDSDNEGRGASLHQTSGTRDAGRLKTETNQARPVARSASYRPPFRQALIDRRTGMPVRVSYEPMKPPAPAAPDIPTPAFPGARTLGTSRAKTVQEANNALYADLVRAQRAKQPFAPARSASERLPARAPTAVATRAEQATRQGQARFEIWLPKPEAADPRRQNPSRARTASAPAPPVRMQSRTEERTSRPPATRPLPHPPLARAPAPGRAPQTTRAPAPAPAPMPAPVPTPALVPTPAPAPKPSHPPDNASASSESPRGLIRAAHARSPPRSNGLVPPSITRTALQLPSDDQTSPFGTPLPAYSEEDLDLPPPYEERWAGMMRRMNSPPTSARAMRDSVVQMAEASQRTENVLRTFGGHAAEAPADAGRDEAVFMLSPGIRFRSRIERDTHELAQKWRWKFLKVRHMYAKMVEAKLAGKFEEALQHRLELRNLVEEEQVLRRDLEVQVGQYNATRAARAG
ncbi:hypothetical protein HDZ31DRAFT_66380 [Schizophyllum fasciatum]